MPPLVWLRPADVFAAAANTDERSPRRVGDHIAHQALTLSPPPPLPRSARGDSHRCSHFCFCFHSIHCACSVRQVARLEGVASKDNGNAPAPEDTSDKSRPNPVVYGTVVGVVLIALGCGAWYARCAARNLREARETGIHRWHPNLLGAPSPQAEMAPPPPQQPHFQYQYPPQQYPPQQAQYPQQYPGGGEVYQGQPVQGIPVPGPGPIPPIQQAVVGSSQAPK